MIDIEFKENQHYSILPNKIYALFHLEKYKEVAKLSEQLIKFNKGESASDYKFWGIANWILGNKFQTIEAWQKAQMCKYQDASGGIDVQVFLYFAAIKTEQIRVKSTTIKAFKKLLKSKRSINWPGPLGHYLLGDMTKKELFSNVVNIPILKERQLCQACFVSAIKKLEAGDTEGYYQKLKDCISYGPPSYHEQIYYLAKGELDASTLAG